MTAPWEEDEITEIHVHADWCRAGYGDDCTCVPYVFMAEDERSEDEIDAACRAHHRAN